MSGIWSTCIAGRGPGGCCGGGDELVDAHRCTGRGDTGRATALRLHPARMVVLAPGQAVGATLGGRHPARRRAARRQRGPGRDLLPGGLGADQRAVHHARPRRRRRGHPPRGAGRPLVLAAVARRPGAGVRHRLRPPPVAGDRVDAAADLRHRRRGGGDAGVLGGARRGDQVPVGPAQPDAGPHRWGHGGRRHRRHRAAGARRRRDRRRRGVVHRADRPVHRGAGHRRRVEPDALRAGRPRAPPHDRADGRGAGLARRVELDGAAGAGAVRLHPARRSPAGLAGGDDGDAAAVAAASARRRGARPRPAPATGPGAHPRPHGVVRARRAADHRLRGVGPHAGPAVGAARRHRRRTGRAGAVHPPPAAPSQRDAPPLRRRGAGGRGTPPPPGRRRGQHRPRTSSRRRPAARAGDLVVRGPLEPPAQHRCGALRHHRPAQPRPARHPRRPATPGGGPAPADARRAADRFARRCRATADRHGARLRRQPLRHRPGPARRRRPGRGPGPRLDDRDGRAAHPAGGARQRVAPRRGASGGRDRPPPRRAGRGRGAGARRRHRVRPRRRAVRLRPGVDADVRRLRRRAGPPRVAAGCRHRGRRRARPRRCRRWRAAPGAHDDDAVAAVARRRRRR